MKEVIMFLNRRETPMPTQLKHLFSTNQIYAWGLVSICISDQIRKLQHFIYKSTYSNKTPWLCELNNTIFKFMMAVFP